MTIRNYALGIDIGGTNTKVGIIDRQGCLKDYLSIPTKTDISAKEFIEIIYQTILEKKWDLTQVDGLGVGAPMANFFTGQIEEAPNLNWKNVPLKKLLEERFQMSSWIENDANLSAIGEMKWGEGSLHQNFILITLGTGVGTGIIINRDLYRGNEGLGGEGGHILIPHQKNRSCSCGGFRHLESFLSAKGIKQTIKEDLNEDWTIEELGRRFSEQDPKAIKIYEQISLELAHGLDSMGVLLAPEAFIIGGGVSKLGAPFFSLVEKKLNQLLHYSLKNKIKIKQAKLSTDKGAIFGGAALVFNQKGI